MHSPERRTRRIFARFAQIGHPPPHRYQRRPSTNMDLRKALSKPFKKLKHRLTEGHRKRGGRFGGESDQGGRDTDGGGSEASQRNSSLRSDVEDVAKSGPSRVGDSSGVKGKKAGQVDSSTSTPAIPPRMESRSTQKTRSFCRCL